MASRFSVSLVCDKPYICTWLGEGGKAVVTALEEKDEADRQTREYGFNMVASDKVAWNRTVPDTRMPEWVKIEFHYIQFSNITYRIIFLITFLHKYVTHYVDAIDTFWLKMWFKYVKLRFLIYDIDPVLEKTTFKSSNCVSLSRAHIFFTLCVCFLTKSIQYIFANIKLRF